MARPAVWAKSYMRWGMIVDTFTIAFTLKRRLKCTMYWPITWPFVGVTWRSATDEPWARHSREKLDTFIFIAVCFAKHTEQQCLKKSHVIIGKPKQPTHTIVSVRYKNSEQCTLISEVSNIYLPFWGSEGYRTWWIKLWYSDRQNASQYTPLSVRRSRRRRTWLLWGTRV